MEFVLKNQNEMNWEELGLIKLKINYTQKSLIF